MRSAQHVAWPEIESFHNIRKYVKAYPELCSAGSVVYQGKIKLHGTNAAVQVLKDGTVLAQSRSQVLTGSGDDNAGFARWVQNNEEAWRKCGIAGADIAIFGEWCGPGIQKGVAITDITKKIFAVFSVYSLTTGIIINEPSHIASIVKNIPDVYVLPWGTEEIVVDWLTAADNLTPVVAKINEWVHEVEKCDPWVKETFGLEGTGEGLVFYPLGIGTDSMSLGFRPIDKKEDFSNLVFKAKGEKHKVVAAKASVQIDPEVAANADGFAKLVLTEARLEQGVGAIGLDMKNTGKFLDWVTKDVMKETNDELVASNLTWPQVQKPISEMARKWFIGRCKQL